MEYFAVRDLTFTYPGAVVPALSHIDLTLQAGQFVTLTGPSGCGKSTLLRLMKPALSPHGTQSGEVLFKGSSLSGMDLRTQAAQIGFVMQDPESQIVTDKVWHELAFGLESLGMDTPTIRRRVAEMASYFGIEAWFHRDVRTLSGGQKQLLCLASIMAMQPAVLLLDEPTAQLDPIAAADFLETVSRINRELGTAVLITEHRLEEVLPMSDAVYVMDEGRILCGGSPARVGEKLRESQNTQFLSMPAAMRIYAAVPPFGTCPVTVREGRQWLAAYRDARGLGDVPPAPVPSVRSGTPALELEEVWFRYEKKEQDVLKGLSLQAYPGEFLAVLGGNGAGKSTALALAAGLHRPYRGRVRLFGEDAEKNGPGSGKVSMLPQDARTLFVKKTVGEDLRACLERTAEGEARLAEAAARCHIGTLLDRHPYDLSGGECQRAALAKLLLRAPRLLLLDEPTRGMDAAFKEEFFEILNGLLRDGVCIVMVSHDIEFCARYAHRCALVFDGAAASEGTPRAFFGGNSFYTTAANRMAREMLPDAVTAEDVIAACGGKPFQGSRGTPRTVQIEETVPSAQDPHSQGAAPPPPVKRPKLTRQTITAFLILLVLVPLTILAGVRLFGDRRYTLISLLILAEALTPFTLLFERRKPQARELVVIAVLCAIGVAGRGAFAMVPSFKPVMAVVILSGVALGAETGFLVGAMTMFVSNFFFGQGPWTPWQMFAMGLIGFLAGLLFSERIGTVRKVLLCIFGALAAFVIYGGIMNPASVVMVHAYPTWEMIWAAYLTGVPVDAVHALATVVFLWLFAKPFLEKIERVRVKYGLIEDTNGTEAGG